jgi:murein DD-endopeptidase MepM/ murein hydrolase activator NlpD
VGALLATLGLSVAAPATAQTGGTAPIGPIAAPLPAPEAPAGPAVPVDANLYGKPAPRITRLPETAAAGDRVRVAGTNLGRITEVVFLGAAGEADDTSVAPLAASRRAVLARVPRTAASGPVALARADGTRSRASRGTLTVVAAPVARADGVVDAEVQNAKVFFGDRRPAELSYVLGGTQAADVRIDLVRVADGTTVQTWSPGEVAPGVLQTVRWDGTADGHVAPGGRYEFRVTAIAAAVSAAPGPAAGTAAPDGFTFLPYRFPIVGAHRYGVGAARFGGGRGHQGQDAFARCGTPLVAARGGTVQFKQYHARAGHYLVIDGEGTGMDFAYMHLREPALVDAGDRVRTGQLIGYVGDTGAADGCHLHFEEWSGPGWYAGGSPGDPLPDLQAWDAQS